MNLKEAFRFQNKLQALMEEAQMILGMDANIINVENTYLRSKVMDGAEDEKMVVAKPSEFADKITEVAQFLSYLLGERETLYAAIRKAKDALDIDMDSETSLNAKRQDLARIYRRMADMRNSEELVTGGGTGYRFNQEGNQVRYLCDVKRVKTINFDRNVIRKLATGLNKKADEVSATLDRCLVTSTVDYELPFDVNDSFAEIFSDFTAKVA